MTLFSTLRPDGGGLLLANLPNPDKLHSPKCHEWVHDEAGLQRFIASYDHPGRALYYAVANLRPGSERCKGNVVSTNFIWAEVDFKDHPGLTPEEILRRIKASPKPPTLIVFSGHGYHCYWQLKEAVDARPGPAQAGVERALEAACRHIGGDKNAAEAARLLRLPTSHNTRNKDERIRVSIIEGGNGSHL